MLAAISAAVSEAAQTASTALDGLALEESLAPIRKGARIIKEISWRWREIGADGRICDLLDSQVGAIEAGCDDIAGVDPRVALREAFDTIRASISALSDIAEATPAVVEDVTAEAAAKPDIAAAVDEPVAMAESVEAPPDDAEAYDEAMLELVAMEMSAPDFDDADTEFAITAPEAHLDEPPQARGRRAGCGFRSPTRRKCRLPSRRKLRLSRHLRWTRCRPRLRRSQSQRSSRRCPRRRLRLSPRRRSARPSWPAVS